MVELEVVLERRVGEPVGLSLGAGLLVAAVRPGSAAAEHLRPADVLLALNGTRLRSRYDYYKRLDELLGSGPLRLRFRRDGPGLAQALAHIPASFHEAVNANDALLRALYRRPGFTYHRLDLQFPPDEDSFGLRLTSRHNRVFVTHLRPGGQASAHLLILDRILCINGVPVVDEAVAKLILDHCNGNVTILVERPVNESTKQEHRGLIKASDSRAPSGIREDNYSCSSPVMELESSVGRLEPWRVRMVEPVRLLSREERLEALVGAHWNPFQLESKDILVDLLTDSGMSALSLSQWGAILSADESYAGSSSIQRFRAAFLEIMPNLSDIFPVHQGRAAERILAEVLAIKDAIIPSNGHFFTTRRNLTHHGITALDLCSPESSDFDSNRSFKGNMDLARLRELLETRGSRVPAVFMCITNNNNGGQPVSLANLSAVRSLCNDFGKPLFLDSCRFAENALFIKLREPGMSELRIVDICRRIFAQVDGMWLSAKKDVLCSIGGCLALNPSQASLSQRAQSLIVMGEGALTYGGLAARDLDCVAVGLQQGLDETYLRHRLASIAEVGRGLARLGVPLYRPVGGSAIFVNAGRLLPHLKSGDFPGLALANALYLEGGIRAADAGCFQLGDQARAEFTRLCFPRRLFTTAHLDHVVATFAALLRRLPAAVPGFRIVGTPDPALRFFTAHLQPLTPPSLPIPQ